MKKSKKLPEVPKEIDMNDFKYFIANDMLVVGVYKEDDDFAHFIVLKGKAHKRGMPGKLDKKVLQNELLTGLSVLIKDPVEAENYGIAK